MAQGRRVERVAALIRREISYLFTKGLRDERIASSIITITHVEVSGDLQHCKVFVSIFGQKDQQDEVFSDLQSQEAFLKGELGRRLNMRRAPEIIFKLDQSIGKGTNVMNLLERLEKERESKDQLFNKLED